MDFTGKVVLITGAAGGIGQALSREFGTRGAAIAALDRADTVHAFSETLGAEGIRAAAAEADIGDAEAVAAAVSALRSALGPVAVLVNNAGYSSRATLAMSDPASWADDVNLNLNGAYNVTHACIDDLRSARGAIVNISSVNGLAGYGDPAYSAAKAGLINYTKSLAMEYGPDGVRANVICPGTVRTPIWEHRIARNPKVLEDLTRWYALGRVAEPEDVARAALFLASDLAAGITGVTLPVDCGLTAANIEMTRALTLEDI